jgi:hypothetical protein
LFGSHQLMDLGATARTSLYQVAAILKQWPLELAFHNYRGGRPLCPSINSRNIATLVESDIHPLGRPGIWSSNPISAVLTTSIPITKDDDGCPAPNQPYTLTNHILQKLTNLWEHEIFTWEQIARLSPIKRPYTLSDADSVIGKPAPPRQNPEHSPKSNLLYPQTPLSELPRSSRHSYTHTIQARPPSHVYSAPLTRSHSRQSCYLTSKAHTTTTPLRLQEARHNHLPRENGGTD